jgi:drug/metabolite transporter (DMT)-like permease
MKQVEKRDLETLIGRAAPIVFVLLWSTGFIGTKYVLNGAEPLTYLTVRMMLAAAIMAVVVAWVRPAWPDRAGIGHSIVAGLLVQGLYLAGTVFAVAHKVPVGLSALIPGLQPILTSILASRFLGERVTPLQWGGLGLGLAGVLLILHGRPMTGEAGWGWFASGISLITITVGTLYQKRYCGGIDWRTGSFIQQISAMVLLGIGAWVLETNVIHWSAEFVLSVVWLAVVLSIGTVGLLYWLLRRQASSQVASLFYLVPAVTALMAFVLFGEKLDAVAIVGMIACGAAVLLVNRAKA